jgi:small subunit ribosomal protein S1
VDTYNVNDELAGKVTKVVTFGAFVEILDGVEGLVHISELANHHVENPREVVQPGDEVRVRILEIDSERRRLSLSVKRVDGQVLPLRPIEGLLDSDLDDVADLGLSEDVFAPPVVPTLQPVNELGESTAPVAPESEAAVAEEAPEVQTPAAEEAPAEEPAAEAPVEEAPAEEAPAEEPAAVEEPAAAEETPAEEPAAEAAPEADTEAPAAE